MKKFVYSIAMLLISCSALAQDTTKSTVKTKMEERKARIESRSAVLGFAFGFDFGWNRFIKNDAPKDPNLELEKGPDFTFNFVGGRVNLFSKQVRLKTALGIDYNTYHFKKDITLDADKDQFSYQISTTKFKKNLLRASYLRMPLLLSIKPDKRSPFQISGGVEAGMLLNGKIKHKSEENGKVKLKDDFNLNPYRMGYVVRLGYGGFNIYSRYYPTNVFDPEVPGTPTMKNFDIGLSFGGI